MTDCYLILSHLQKDHNIGALLRSAAAFGVTEVVLVGRRKVPTTAAGGMDHVVRRTAFARFQDAVDHVRAKGARILGVEIDPSSKPIDEHPFDGPKFAPRTDDPNRNAAASQGASEAA